MKKNSSLIVVMVLMFFASHQITAQENNNWIAPAHSDSVKNPFVGNARATAEGKEIYNQMCVLCHGLKGKGNGQAGLSLVKKPANFLALKVINQTDGNIFWKITNGKAPMASYEELLTDDQRWKLVNYIRELEINKIKK
ncbi:cytochrome c [Flavobacterium sp.]|uniref:c-type cytochrome n=1 Tax=Flavobacterium sp. TaxID=239 RepID=UPI0025C48641|nr:cytochrome c [Flavobacterium sp.]MBA4276343.1 cytochrome c class I [Flavobacterium sp.]